MSTNKISNKNRNWRWEAIGRNIFGENYEKVKIRRSNLVTRVSTQRVKDLQNVKNKQSWG